MEIIFLDNAKEIRDSFFDRFVMTWEEFQRKQHKSITETLETSYPINQAWYEQAYMWDRMDPKFPTVSLKESLTFLREYNDSVLFLSEEGQDIRYQGKQIVNFVAQADARVLADRIEQEWFECYELAEQNMYNPDAFLPEDLYVFDSSMTWCVVFTHETTDWESEISDPMKAAASRVCILCK